MFLCENAPSSWWETAVVYKGTEYTTGHILYKYMAAQKKITSLFKPYSSLQADIVYQAPCMGGWACRAPAWFLNYSSAEKIEVTWLCVP